MSRKKSAPKKLNVVDPKYKSVIIPKLINSLMYDGKKTIAEKIVYDAIDKIKSKSKDEPITVFNQAISNIKPTVEVRSRRIGGATFQIPHPVREDRRISLGMKWMISAARNRNEKTMEAKLSAELIAAYKEEGSAYKKKQDTHRMAEANKAFSHFRF